MSRRGKRTEKADTSPGRLGSRIESDSLFSRSPRPSSSLLALLPAAASGARSRSLRRAKPSSRHPRHRESRSPRELWLDGRAHPAPGPAGERGHSFRSRPRARAAHPSHPRFHFHVALSDRTRSPRQRHLPAERFSADARDDPAWRWLPERGLRRRVRARRPIRIESRDSTFTTTTTARSAAT